MLGLLFLGLFLVGCASQQGHSVRGIASEEEQEHIENHRLGTGGRF